MDVDVIGYIARHASNHDKTFTAFAEAIRIHVQEVGIDGLIEIEEEFICVDPLI